MPATLRDPLDTIQAVLGLSQTELAELFGVRQPSLAAWRGGRIPATRRASVERLADLADVLHRQLLPERIPEIVRTPDPWLGDRSILDTIRERGPEPVYGYLARLFRYDG